MFGLNHLKQTRFYQEAFTQGKKEGVRLQKLKIAPLFLRLGLSVEQVAQELGLSVEVTQAAT
ncbi:MAG: Rpn family recombination-promoting nuclease/putative transposase [Tolypothrix sp. Co-bin9]|nr:Rpn family recombination-promoting nuclease/putative transposase [Tolypothrix sp. Co-bin9]